jgi:stage V sporulation protein SpoVS
LYNDYINGNFIHFIAATLKGQHDRLASEGSPWTSSKFLASHALQRWQARSQGLSGNIKRAEVQAIGASAIIHCESHGAELKAILQKMFIRLSFNPEFVDVEIDQKVRTAIKFVVEPPLKCHPFDITIMPSCAR